MSVRPKLAPFIGLIYQILKDDIGAEMVSGTPSPCSPRGSYRPALRPGCRVARTERRKRLSAPRGTERGRIYSSRARNGSGTKKRFSA